MGILWLFLLKHKEVKWLTYNHTSNKQNLGSKSQSRNTNRLKCWPCPAPVPHQVLKIPKRGGNGSFSQRARKWVDWTRLLTDKALKYKSAQGRGLIQTKEGRGVAFKGGFQEEVMLSWVWKNKQEWADWEVGKKRKVFPAKQTGVQRPGAFGNWELFTLLAHKGRCGEVQESHVPRWAGGTSVLPRGILILSLRWGHQWRILSKGKILSDLHVRTITLEDSWRQCGGWLRGGCYGNREDKLRCKYSGLSKKG